VTDSKTLHGLAQECGVLLSALAHVGQAGPEPAAATFEAGLSYLELKAKPSLAPSETSSLPAVGAALDKLVRVSPLLKRQLIAACTATIALDGQVTVEEAEILRAVADSLDVPMPPFLAGESAEVVAKSRAGQGQALRPAQPREERCQAPS